MLTFLRKIRKSLIGPLSAGQAGGKTRRYVLYAFGEIALVVIGILIAIGLNSWNQNRVNLNREKEILSSIEKEFKQNIVDLERYIGSISVANNHRAEILSKLEEFGPNYVPIDSDSIEYHLNHSYEESSLDLQQGSILAIINSNEMSLIRNDTLLTLLTSWEMKNKDHNEDDWMYLDILYHNYLPHLAKYYPMKNLHYSSLDDVSSGRPYSLFKNEFSGFISKSSSKYPTDLLGLIKDSEFESLLIWMDIKFGHRMAESQRLESHMRSILKIIKHELK